MGGGLNTVNKDQNGARLIMASGEVTWKGPCLQTRITVPRGARTLLFNANLPAENHCGLPLGSDREPQTSCHTRWVRVQGRKRSDQEPGPCKWRRGRGRGGGALQPPLTAPLPPASQGLANRLPLTGPKFLCHRLCRAGMGTGRQSPRRDARGPRKPRKGEW